MAWTHFTDYLNPGQRIAKPQRDELIDAFAERVLALDGYESAAVDVPTLEAIKASRLAHQRISYTAPIRTAGETTDRIGAEMLLELRFLSRNYAIDSEQGAFYFTPPAQHPDFVTRNQLITSAREISTTNIVWCAAQDLGYSAAEFDSLFPSILRADSTHLWNLLRRAIMRLDWHRLGTQNTGGSWTDGWLVGSGLRFWRSTGLEPSWEDAVAAHQGAVDTPTSGSTGSAFSTTLYPTDRYDMATSRIVRGGGFIPDLPIYDGYSLRLWVNAGSDRANVPWTCGTCPIEGSTVILTDCDVDNARPIPTSGPVMLVAEELTDGGIVGVQAAPQAHFGSGYSLMQPSAGGVLHAGIAFGWQASYADGPRTALIRPNWTHPADP